jgi:hypothetical protein
MTPTDEQGGNSRAVATQHSFADLFSELFPPEANVSPSVWSRSWVVDNYIPARLMTDHELADQFLVTSQRSECSPHAWRR